MTQRKTRRGLGRGLEALIQPAHGESRVDADESMQSTTEEESTYPSTDVKSRYGTEDAVASVKFSRPSDIFFGDQPSNLGNRSERSRMPNPLLTSENRAKSDDRATANPGTQVLEIPLSQISPNPRQPREVFDEDDLRELVRSIEEVGVLQPVVVREVSRGTYELIMGERRFRASQRLSRETIPAIVRETTDKNLLLEALIENIHRSDLNPLEEAAAYQQLMADFEWTQEELARRLGRSRPQISNTLRLMKLPPVIQSRVASGVLSGGHARALLGLPTESAMTEVSQKIIQNGLSVRATEELVATYVPRETHSRRVPKTKDHRFVDIASALTDELDTAVDISLGAKKGKITIDFASADDLQRILNLIQPTRR